MAQLFTGTQKYDVHGNLSRDCRQAQLFAHLLVGKRIKYGSVIESLRVLPLLVLFFHENNKLSLLVFFFREKEQAFHQWRKGFDRKMQKVVAGKRQGYKARHIQHGRMTRGQEGRITI